MEQKNFTHRDNSFADLFAGLGGFHVGISKLGMDCVFASELDDELRGVYEENFGLMPNGDIRSVDEKSIPPHRVLCAGFPCQPFSRAGKKKGAACPESGKLIDDVLRIVKHHLPDYVLLENVPSILTIQDGEFWEHIKGSFGELGYHLDHKIYSPHDFGIPQRRNRVFVVASRVGLSHFKWPDARPNTISTINTFALEENRQIEPEKMDILNKWQTYIATVKEITFEPILAAEFGATYPFQNFRKMKLSEARKYKGAFGQSLADCSTWNEVISKLPHYAQNEKGEPAKWLHKPISISRDTYERHSAFLDEWKLDLIGSHNSWQKFEWQGLKNNLNIWDHIIQFRASGIRIIKPHCAPSLVAMTPTQTPILGPEKRYMNVREAASLQSLENLKTFPENNARAFKALGNAVNAYIVGEIAANLITGPELLN